MAANDNIDKSDSAVISMKEFLDFLKLTCQVNESIQKTNTKSSINYDMLIKNELVEKILARTSGNGGEATNEPSPSLTDKTTERREVSRRRPSIVNQKHKETRGKIDQTLHAKLDELIGEGILDSVLPFICPNEPQLSSSTITDHSAKQAKDKPSVAAAKGSQINEKQSKQPDEVKKPTKTSADSQSLRQSRRKSLANATSSGDGKPDFDVTIHVCDEVKNISKDFHCPQKLLIQKMNYFADVTAGQKLEDMDISVHCDLLIFEWLIRWVKRDESSPNDWPILDPVNVVPILVSASFLQMEPLLLDCLSFCHARLNDVVKSSVNLSCLNDGIIARLAAMFTNLELELVRDKKDRIAPRIWIKLIQSLCETEPQSLRGHFCSLASLFRCNRCGKYLTQSVASFVHCLPQSMRLNRWGELVSHHSKDNAWDVNNYVSTLNKDLRSWRKVYWRLWAHCHFLYCSTCETHFPVYQMKWCPHHTDLPQFLGPTAEGRPSGPAGRYPCCGVSVYRFETLPGPTGCHYREHTVQIENDRDRAILNLAQVASEGGCVFVDPSPMKIPSIGNEPWWNGLPLIPHRSKQGLLPSLVLDDKSKGKGLVRQVSMTMDSSSETESSEITKKSTSITRQISTTSSDGAESEYSSPRRFKSRSNKRRVKMSGGRYWSGEISARSNQDNQREFEERAMKQVIAMVDKRTGCDASNVKYQNYQQGGIYFQLEADWRESCKYKATVSKLKFQNCNQK